MEEHPSRAVMIVLGVTAALALGGGIIAWAWPYVQHILPG